MNGAATVLICASLAVAASQPWKSKPYEQWSKYDVSVILEDSPWAKTLSVGGTLHLKGNDNLDGSSGSMSGGGTARGGAGSLTLGGGGAAGYSPIMPAEHDQPLGVDPRAPKVYTVLWWSARTVRRAVAQDFVLTGKEDAATAQLQVASVPDDLEIMVHGADMSLFNNRPKGSFLTNTYLQLRHTQKKIAPTRVEYMKTAEGHVSAVIFHFPAKDATGEPLIPRDEKRVDFYCRVGEGNIITFFEPAQMVDNQGVDL